MEAQASVPDLNFQVESIAPLKHSAVPALLFKLRVTNATAEPIHSVLLQCQIMLEVAGRRYSAEEQEYLLDLFGAPEQWDRTLRRMLWTVAHAQIQSFHESTLADLQVPCTFDFNVAATKYFAALKSGEVPLTLLFSGAVFYAGEGRNLQVARIAWEKEAGCRLKVEVWREMMEIYYPRSVWLRLGRDAFERLYRYKMRFGIPTFEQALERLVPEVELGPEVDLEKERGLENGLEVSPEDENNGEEMIH